MNQIRVTEQLLKWLKLAALKLAAHQEMSYTVRLWNPERVQTHFQAGSDPLLSIPVETQEMHIIHLTAHPLGNRYLRRSDFQHPS